MGNHQPNHYLKVKPSPSKQTMVEMSASSGIDDVVYEEVVTKQQVCCFKYEKILRRKIVWESKFLDQLARRVPYFPWARQLIDLVSQNELPKLKYYKQVHYLKKEKPIIIAKAEADILSSPDEVERFKKNLKKSVIISFGPNTKMSAEVMGNVFKSSIPIQSLQSNSRLCKTDNHDSRKAHFPSSMVFLRKNSRNSSENSIKNHNSRSSSLGRVSSKIQIDKDVPKQTAAELQIFMKFSTIVERHLSDECCVLGKIRRLFVQQFSKNYRNPEERIDLEYVIESIQQFLNLLKDAMMGYYDLQIFSSGDGSNMFISNEENILGTCTAILFRDHIFYSCLFNLISLEFKEKEQQFEKILNHLRGSGPERFTVKHKFCLNALTMKSYVRELCAQSGGSVNVVQNIQINQIVMQHGEPYKNCMINLNEMAKSRSPVNKLKSIMSCSDGITKQIQRFYDSNALKRQKWMLDPDQVLSIFCYLIVGARVEHLHTHLFILENFISSHQQISGSGYYLSVLKCAVEQLQNQFGEEIASKQLRTNRTNETNGENAHKFMKLV